MGGIALLKVVHVNNSATSFDPTKSCTAHQTSSCTSNKHAQSANIAAKHPRPLCTLRPHPHWHRATTPGCRCGRAGSRAFARGRASPSLHCLVACTAP